jgi:hypothetical protein
MKTINEAYEISTDEGKRTIFGSYYQNLDLKVRTSLREINNNANDGIQQVFECQFDERKRELEKADLWNPCYDLLLLKARKGQLDSRILIEMELLK